MCFSHFTITKRENGYVNVIIYHDINMYYPLHQGIAIQIIQVFFYKGGLLSKLLSLNPYDGRAQQHALFMV
jgi:hypothetical protein